ncbi:hypothetical protein KY312_01270 [Candidatus Woesearchaeota archaeon]|nr:hypothetical protein [Candidatus Woesearchaeota archaeon]
MKKCLIFLLLSIFVLISVSSAFAAGLGEPCNLDTDCDGSLECDIVRKICCTDGDPIDCTSGSDCCQELFSKYWGCEEGDCCREAKSQCSSQSECCFGLLCHAGKCCEDECAQCTQDADCCYENKCQGATVKKCCRPEGEQCAIGLGHCCCEPLECIIPEGVNVGVCGTPPDCPAGAVQVYMSDTETNTIVATGHGTDGNPVDSTTVSPGEEFEVTVSFDSDDIIYAEIIESLVVIGSAEGYTSFAELADVILYAEEGAYTGSVDVSYDDEYIGTLSAGDSITIADPVDGAKVILGPFDLDPSQIPQEGIIFEVCGVKTGPGPSPEFNSIAGVIAILVIVAVAFLLLKKKQ